MDSVSDQRCSISLKPALILFDCDGTMTDSHGVIVQAMQAAFQDVGLVVPEGAAVNDVIGLSLSKAITQLMTIEQGEDLALCERVSQQYRQHYSLAEDSVVLFSQVRETLLDLQSAGYWLGVVTGKSHSGLLRVLNKFELNEMFYVLRTADCTHSKPHPAMVLECMQEMGVTADQTVVVGDAVFDMQMADAAGVRALGVSFGVGSRAELLHAGAEYVVDHFSDVLNHFPTLHDKAVSRTMPNINQCCRKDREF